MTNTNLEIKIEALSKGVKMYEIANAIGKSEATLCRLLRTPLKDEDKQRILAAIKAVADSR